MDFNLHIARSLDKQLEKLSTSCKKSELAVLKCRQLLSDIREYGVQHESVLTKRTRKGEQRLKNCVKYDMGGGYRLVTVMVENHLFVTSLGSHDETDQWFDRHKNDDFIAENPHYSRERICLSRGASNPTSPAAEQPIETDAYEAQLEAKLDETILLLIFQGLNRNRQVVLEKRT